MNTPGTQTSEITLVTAPTIQMSQQLNGCIIYRKGLVDVVSDGTNTALVMQQGSLKRSGGQGDVLAGLLGTFAAFKYTPQDKPNSD